ncbi:acetyl-coenzyme A synthetase N-terminal domain-containing protein [Streptomyces sp. NPDC054783]
MDTGRRELEGADVAVFMERLEETRGLGFADYAELWRWSSTDLAGFWSEVWEYYGLDAVTAYDEVLGDATMPGAPRLGGARLVIGATPPAPAPPAPPPDSNPAGGLLVGVVGVLPRGPRHPIRRGAGRRHQAGRPVVRGRPAGLRRTTPGPGHRRASTDLHR